MRAGKSQIVGGVAVAVLATSAGIAQGGRPADCWRLELPRSRHFLCCGRMPNDSLDGLPRPDCWTSGIARHSAEACCDSARLSVLEVRAEISPSSNASTPCQSAHVDVWNFIEATAERVHWGGDLLASMPDAKVAHSSAYAALDDGLGDGDESQFLVDADSTYETCAPALLLATLSRATRALLQDDAEAADLWIDAYHAWSSLRWTVALCWHNYLDPLVVPTLRKAFLQLEILHRVMRSPEEVCTDFVDTMAVLLESATIFSLTVSWLHTGNLIMYPGLSITALVISHYGHLLPDSPRFNGARQLAHLFSARRFMDLKAHIGSWHLVAAKELRARINFIQEPAKYPLCADALHQLHVGMDAQMQWMYDAGWVRWHEGAVPPTPRAPSGGAERAPLAIWERRISSVFSEGVKDPVLERLFGLLGVGNRYYVEVGTQLGDQCNTRHLRVRYGFYGLMLDDNFQNPEINQRRHFVTPGNVCDLFQKYDVPMDLDLLSLDTDGNEWLLWMTLQRCRFSPRVVVIEYNMDMPHHEDRFVRYTDFPVHRICLADGKFSRFAGGSMTGMMKLGRHLGYHLVHASVAGTTDLIFVRQDVLDDAGMMFPAQNNPPALCALATYQTPPPEGVADACAGKTLTTNDLAPPMAIFTTSEAILAGDYWLHGFWTEQGIKDTFC